MKAQITAQMEAQITAQIKTTILTKNFDVFSYQMMREINTLPLLKITKEEDLQSSVLIIIEVPNDALTLQQLLRERNVTFSQVVSLFEAIDSLIESLKSYLIPVEELCLNEAHIYYNHTRQQWLFLVMPSIETPLFIEKTVDEQQRRLLKTIICHESQPVPFTLNAFNHFIIDYSMLPIVWLKQIERHTITETSNMQRKKKSNGLFQKKTEPKSSLKSKDVSYKREKRPSWLKRLMHKPPKKNVQEPLQRHVLQSRDQPSNKSILNAPTPVLKETVKLSKYPCLMCYKTHERYYLYYDYLYIGRGEQCHIRLHDDMISQKHASIQYIKPHYILKDENSKNGVYVEGERLTNAHTLKNGDAVQIGNLEFIFVT